MTQLSKLHTVAKQRLDGARLSPSLSAVITAHARWQELTEEPANFTAAKKDLDVLLQQLPMAELDALAHDPALRDALRQVKSELAAPAPDREPEPTSELARHRERGRSM